MYATDLDWKFHSLAEELSILDINDNTLFILVKPTPTYDSDAVAL